MQLTGQITNIQPDGGYDSRNGYINTSQMTINTTQGPVTGRIGSKSTPYPMQVGEQITVEQSNKGYGIEFKKINPQYAGGGQQQGQQQPRQQAPRPAQGGGNKDRLIVTQVAYKALTSNQNCTEEFLRRDVDMIMRVAENKPAPQQPQSQFTPDGNLADDPFSGYQG